MTTTASSVPGFAPGLMVVNGFTLNVPDRASEFEKLFVEHVEFMRAQKGFTAHQMVRSTGDGTSYVNVGWWQEADDFQKIMRSEMFQNHARLFHDLVSVQAAPSRLLYAAEPASRIGSEDPDFPFVTVERFTAEPGADLPGLFAARTAVAPLDGLGWAALGVALPEPAAFTAIARWRSEDSYDWTRETPIHRTMTERAELALVAGESLAASRGADAEA